MCEHAFEVLRRRLMGLEDKAKTLSDLLWENMLEWSRWLRLGVVEGKQVELPSKFQEKWVRLEDAEKEIERVKGEKRC